MLQSEQPLDVISLEFKNFLILIIFQYKHLILLVLDLFLKEYIEFSGLHEAESQVLWDNNVHNVNLFDNYSVWIEFPLKVILELRCQLSFNITDSLNFDLF